MASARASQARDPQTWLSAFSTCISERKEGGEEPGVEVVPDKDGATVKKRGVFRGALGKRSPTAEAGMRRAGKGLGGAVRRPWSEKRQRKKRQTHTGSRDRLETPPLQGRLVMDAGAR